MEKEGAPNFSETTEQKTFLPSNIQQPLPVKLFQAAARIQEDISRSNNYSNYLPFDSVNIPFKLPKKITNFVLSPCQYHIQLNKTYKIKKFIRNDFPIY